MTFYYPVIVTKRGDGFYASFPDFPGCFGEGADRESALEDAKHEGRCCIAAELMEENPLPRRSLPEDLCLHQGEELVLLALVMPREENWSWLG